MSPGVKLVGPTSNCPSDCYGNENENESSTDEGSRNASHDTHNWTYEPGRSPEARESGGIEYIGLFSGLDVRPEQALKGVIAC